MRDEKKCPLSLWERARVRAVLASNPDSFP
jgi:hypothetical protein